MGLSTCEFSLFVKEAAFRSLWSTTAQAVPYSSQKGSPDGTTIQSDYSNARTN